jgi:hypothetical protein
LQNRLTVGQNWTKSMIFLREAKREFVIARIFLYG